MGSLKSFVKAVRKAKTIADERTVVRKESAAIRTSFRDPNLDHNTRRINISKLLYLYILGEKTHFGQVECLKLLASTRFADKRLGYLACMLLLDENQEVLTLLTNSLDNDMQHPNTFIVGLALTCLGNLASPELARDLYANVDKILASSTSVFLRKKACVVAAKLVERDPDLGEVFLPRATALMGDKSPSILLGVCRLVQSLHSHVPDSRPTLAKMIPRIIGHIKRVITSGYMPDYDVLGVTDPFLQVTLLETLRVLAVDESLSQPYLEETNDILTQVASNLENGKNSAQAILYECVKTIFAIKSDQSLRVLGVNLLGWFLSCKDNNARYVALEMLLTVINFEPLAVQRHRATIVSCLSDGDISIRRRALELAFAIINEQNVRVLVREILAFLEACSDNELKPYITSQLTIAAAKHSPNEKWHCDTLVRMLKLSGNFVTADIISSILAFIMRCSDPELKKHVVSKLAASCLEDPSQYGLALVTVWCLGEYADLVLTTSVEVSGKTETLTESKVLDLFSTVFNNSNYSEAETTQLTSYILTAALKLSVKFTQSQTIEQLRLLISSKANDSNLEIQTRAVEYQQIFAQDSKLKQGLLSKMPVPPLKEREGLTLQGAAKPKQTAQGSLSSAATGGDDLLDLLGDDSTPTAPPPVSKTDNDLLSDIFGSSGPSVPSSSAPKPSNGGGLLDVFDSAPKQGLEVFANGHLRIQFYPGKFGNGEAQVDVDITSMSPSDRIDHVQLLIAVPKTQKLSISTTSGTDSLVTGNIIKQSLKVVGSQGSKVKLRVKVRYNLNGAATEDQFDFGRFDQTL